MVGGMVVLAVGGAAYGAVKLSQKDAQRIEEHTGQSVEELSDEELTGAMNDLGIQSQEINEEDRIGQLLDYYEKTIDQFGNRTL